MSFDAPRFLGLLGLTVPLALFAFLRYRKRRDILFLLLPPGGAGGEAGLRFRYLCSTLAFLIWFSCLVIALAGPRWGSALVPEFYRGSDVVLAIDLSRSMEVRDGAGGSPGGSSPSALPAVGEGHPRDRGPSRLDAALGLARTLAAASGGGRFAVAIGKGAGVLAVPLTEDTEAVLTFLEGLSSSAITGRGTNLESLVDAALGAFQDAFPARRWIILFSDGEALSGSLAQAVDRALKARVMITTVALGSETGGPVPEDPEKGSEDTVMSYLNPGPLQSAAERTGGLYLEAGEKDTAARLAEQFRGVSPDSVSAAFRREAKSQSHLFIFAALGAWGIAVLAGKRRKGYGEKNV